jgi:hypothetical protein
MESNMKPLSYEQYVRGSAYGTNDFEDNADATVTDRVSSLMWTKDDSGRGMNWQEALVWAQTRNAEKYLGYSDWRLPNAKELQGIVDCSHSPDSTSSPARNVRFTSTGVTNEAGQPDYPYYWTGTTHESQSDGTDGAITGDAAVYIQFGRAMGYMKGPMHPQRNWVDVHGGGAQRSDPKTGDPAVYPVGCGPRGSPISLGWCPRNQQQPNHDDLYIGTCQYASDENLICVRNKPIQKIDSDEVKLDEVHKNKQKITL